MGWEYNKVVQQGDSGMGVQQGDNGMEYNKLIAGWSTR